MLAQKMILMMMIIIILLCAISHPAARLIHTPTVALACEPRNVNAFQGRKKAPHIMRPESEGWIAHRTPISSICHPNSHPARPLRK